MSKKESKISKIMKAPIRALIKVKNLYVRSLTECSVHFDLVSVVGCPTPQVIQRSYSSSSSAAATSAKSTSSDDHFRELVKTASIRPLPRGILIKSRSVGIARIDEDKPFEEDDDDHRRFEVVKAIRADVYSRSRSLAVPRRNYIMA